MQDKAVTDSPDAVIVLVEWVKVTEGQPPMMKAPIVFMGPDKARLAEQRAIEMFNGDQAATGFLSASDADAARARWLRALKSGQPAPLNVRSCLRWRLVVGER
jgi:hypothetical protein